MESVSIDRVAGCGAPYVRIYIDRYIYIFFLTGQGMGDCQARSWSNLDCLFALHSQPGLGVRRSCDCKTCQIP
jgi:hypothetical protein